MAGDERPAAVLPVNALERIEVIRSPGSVLYGTNAFSGVINLITKKARGQSAMLRTYGVGTAGSGASGEIMMERGKLSVMAAGQLRFDPAWTTAYGDAYQRPVFQNAEIQNRGPGALMRGRIQAPACDGRLHRVAIELLRERHWGEPLAPWICERRIFACAVG